MVPIPVHPHKALSPDGQAMARAFERAKAEKLVCYPNQDGSWVCKGYTIVVTGPRPQDVRCSCIAGQNRLTCKHAVCVIFCRKHHVRPIRPQVPQRPVPTHDPLAEYFQ